MHTMPAGPPRPTFRGAAETLCSFAGKIRVVGTDFFYNGERIAVPTRARQPVTQADASARNAMFSRGGNRFEDRCVLLLETDWLVDFGEMFHSPGSSFYTNAGFALIARREEIMVWFLC